MDSVISELVDKLIADGVKSISEENHPDIKSSKNAMENTAKTPDFAGKGKKAPRYLLVNMTKGDPSCDLNHNKLPYNCQPTDCNEPINVVHSCKSSEDLSLFATRRNDASKCEEHFADSSSEEYFSEGYVTPDCSTAEENVPNEKKPFDSYSEKEHCYDLQSPGLTVENNIKVTRTNVSQEDEVNENTKIEIDIDSLSKDDIVAILSDNEKLVNRMHQMEEHYIEQLEEAGWQLIEANTTRARDAERAYQQGFELGSNGSTGELREKISRQGEIIENLSAANFALKDRMARQNCEAMSIQNHYLRDYGELRNAFQDLLDKSIADGQRYVKLPDSTVKQLFQALCTRDKAIATCTELQIIITNLRMQYYTLERKYCDLEQLMKTSYHLGPHANQMAPKGDFESSMPGQRPRYTEPRMLPQPIQAPLVVYDAEMLFIKNFEIGHEIYSYEV